MGDHGPTPGHAYRREGPGQVNWRPVLAKVKAALMRRGRSEHDAEDLVQEAWVRLAQYEQAQPVVQPEAFLMRAALNLSIDTHRQRRSQGDAASDELDGRLVSTPGERATSPGSLRPDTTRTRARRGQLHPDRETPPVSGASRRHAQCS